MEVEIPRGFVWSIRLQLAEDSWEDTAGPFDLIPNEAVWRDIQPYLQSRGYLLRERYHPGWKPSPPSKGPYSDCDFELNYHVWLLPEVLDAIRISDGLHVMLKHVSLQREWSRELDIYTRLSSPRARSDPRNCTSVLIDVIDMGNDIDAILVLPMLRDVDEPNFETVGEILHFMQCISAGVEFLHENHIAHMDIASPNIMMDPGSMFERPWHPISTAFAKDHAGVWDLYYPTSRTYAEDLQYKIIDFGHSFMFSSKADYHHVAQSQGRDRTVPEQQGDNTVPYDPFAVDIYSLGRMFQRMFVEGYTNMSFISPLLEPMMQQDPSLRPDAKTVAKEFRHLANTASWQLRRTEVRDIMYPDPIGSRWRWFGPQWMYYWRCFYRTLGQLLLASLTKFAYVPFNRVNSRLGLFSR